MVFVQHQIGFGQVFAHARFFLPRQLDERFDVIAHHGAFGRHRRHHFQFAQFGQSFVFAFLAHARCFDLLFQLFKIVGIFIVAQFFLDDFDLLVQIIIALVFLHLALHFAANAFFQLGNFQFAFDLRQQVFHARADIGQIQQVLAVFQFKLQMGGDDVGQAAVVVNIVNAGHDFGGDFFVGFDVLVELSQQGAAQGFTVFRRAVVFGQHFDLGFEIFAVVLDGHSLGALCAFHQHLHGAVRQLQHLHHTCDGADLVQVFGGGVFNARIALRQQEDVLFFFCHGVQGGNGFAAADKQGQHHMGINHHVAQGQGRQCDAFGFFTGHDFLWIV